MSTNILDLPDDELVAACRRGDDDATRILFERYQGRVQGFIRNLLRTTGCARLDHAEDVFQETWTRAYPALGRVNRTFGSYLFKIAKHTAFDHLRSGCIRRQTNEQPLEELLLQRPQVSSIHEVIESTLLAKELLVIADGISEAFGKIFRLRDITGLEFVEIAQTLGMSKDQIRNIYYRNLRLLKAEAKRLRENASTYKTGRKDNRHEELQ